MKDKTKNIITAIAGAIEGYLIYLAQGVAEEDPAKYPAPFNHDALQGVYPHISGSMGYVAMFFIVAIVIVQILFYFLTENDYKNWLSKLFQHIIDQSLGGQTYETRITLYVESEGWRFLVVSLLFAVSRFFTEGTIRYFAAIPNPMKKCLRPYVRFAYPEKERAYTTFHAVSKENEKCEGAVEQCYKTGKVVSISTTYINDINLPASQAQLGREEQRRVMEYMTATGIKYRKLRLLQRKANVVYAIPLRRGTHIWGVLIFDNNSEQNPIDFQDKLKDVIDNYQKIIQLTIENI